MSYRTDTAPETFTLFSVGVTSQIFNEKPSVISTENAP